MPYSRSLLAYPDIQEYLDRALASPGGIRIDFDGDAETKRKAAQNFVFRACQYRALVARESKNYRQPDDPMYGRCDYERLKIMNKKTHVEIVFWKNLKLKVTELPEAAE